MQSFMQGMERRRISKTRISEFSFATMLKGISVFFAKENSEILVFDMRRLSMPCIKDCNNHRLLTDNLLCTMATKHCELNNKITHLSRRSTREKLISYLSEQQNIQKSTIFTIPFNRQELADFLSVERSAMTKELTRMKNDGIIDFDGRTFKLKI